VHKDTAAQRRSRTFGVSRWSVVQWTKLHRSNGAQALAPKRRGRRAGEAGKLSIKQAQRIRALVVGKMPEQLKLPFYLWTRAAVQLLIKQEYGVRLSLTAVGGYLKRWGLTIQRPVKRAYERNEEAIARWLAEVYPRIASRAKREKALIYWADETGLRSDDVRGRSFALDISLTFAQSAPEAGTFSILAPARGVGMADVANLPDGGRKRQALGQLS